MQESSASVDEYLKSFMGHQARVLTEIREQLKLLLPGAQETISYGMPTLKIGGTPLVSFGGFQDHNSLFPGPSAILELESEFGPLEHSKGTIRFPVDLEPKKKLLRRLVEIRIREINAGYPKKTGTFKEFYLNGFLKSEGKYRAGQMHGNWRFYRKDGSLMRSGRLEGGQPVGDWQTFLRPE